MTTLMADLVAQQQKGEEPGQHTTEKAKQLLAQILLPKQITGKLIEKYIRKAMRIGAWRKLSPQKKALLFTARRFKIFYSHFMRQLLQQIVIDIEITTIKGKALYYGILVTIKQMAVITERALSNIKILLPRILFLGITQLNNPYLVQHL